MNQALRRDEMIRALEHEAKGSFYVVQRALAETSRDANSNELDIQAVIERIRLILKEADTSKHIEAAE